MVTPPDRPTSVRPVDYKGEPLDAARGPGLGCFWFQLGLLLVLVVLTPLSVAWDWPAAISTVLLFLVLILLLFAGQTVIFLLRLVAADRRDGRDGRRRPLASATRTVGELEDAAPPGGAPGDRSLTTPAGPPADRGGAGTADPVVRE
jgi:hypothetical protein